MDLSTQHLCVPIYVYGLGLISQETKTGATYTNYRAYQFDNRRSALTLTNQSGEITDRFFFDPYGELIGRHGNTDTIFMYVGKYGVQTDNNGLLYMRARYYNTDIKRFINVDPIRDGLNWYGYVSGNPIDFIDPTGLVLVLKGKRTEVWTILKNIEDFTQDKLIINRRSVEGVLTEDEYIVKIDKQVDNKCSKYLGDSCNAGNRLIRRIISSSKTVVIQVTTESNYEKDDNSANAINGKGSDATVFFNPKADPNIKTVDSEGNVVPAKRPAYIGLAHELIHADRSMRGVAIDYDTRDEYKYQIAAAAGDPMDGYVAIYETVNERKEELATVGLAYNNPGDITENMIRQEQGLPLRGAY